MSFIIDDTKEKNIPRSEKYKDNVIKHQCYTVIREICYFKRLFTDGALELVRYDSQAKMWMILCFKA